MKPRQAFLADLNEARSTTISNISSLEAGINSGEFNFLYHSHHLPEGFVIIQAEIPDLPEYPRVHHCFLYINQDQRPPQIVPNTLASISTEIAGKDIILTLRTVASALDQALDPSIPIEISDSEEGFEGDEFAFDEDDEDDQMFSAEPHTTPSAQYGTARFARTAAEAIAMKRIRSDLRSAKRAGFKVGVLGNLSNTGIVCISVRVTKLGISEEAMQAWGLRRKHYLILMIRFFHGYQTIEQIQNESTLSGATQIRVGLCERYKPSFDDAAAAFASPAQTTDSKVTSAPLTSPDSTTGASLEPLFIGGSINDLFRDRFAQILKYRLACAFPWSGAEMFYNEIQGKNMGDVNIDDPRYLAHEDMNARTLPAIVVADTIEETISGLALSLPLAAMQFLLRHFVRCVEFCLICHCRVENSFEALKPYVCSKPLCLYQYMALGFGPSIAWEIITQPYVVDLLVSFCYVSARRGQLKEFPTGIAMRVPLLPHLGTPIYDYRGRTSGANIDTKTPPRVQPKQDNFLLAWLDRVKSELLIESRTISPVRPGDWLAIQSASLDGTLHYRVEDISFFPTVKLDGDGLFVANQKPPISTSSESDDLSPSLEARPGYLNVSVYLYSSNFDDLSSTQKHNCVTMLLDTLPSVPSLREYLLAPHQSQNPQLKSRRHDLSESALNLLRWILASNRSCIMQVDKLAEKHVGAASSKLQVGGSEDRVSSMDDYMQFRFAQGAPDKEQRFINAVNSVATRTKNPHPTLFAWHGSPFENWHSIIREGLNFNEVRHGRAFGNGIYLSSNACTSLGYSNMNRGYVASEEAGVWPNSVLKVSNAISLQEVVNCPAEFVHREPHYVVADVDWVQTRYLFVKADTSPTQAPIPVYRYHQDPAATARGANNQPVVIPITAVSKSRRPVMDAKSLTHGSKKVKTQGITDQQSAEDAQDDANSIISDLADREFLDSDMEDDDLAFNSPEEVSNGGIKRQLDTVTKVSQADDWCLSDFVPGSLDTSCFQKLQPPAFATTQGTKQLSRTLKELVNVQKSSPLHELGWYIDADKIENLYEWIVELHSFDKTIPLASDMKKAGITSIVLEIRFTANFPFSPPFVRVVRPRFLPFLAGGGGHITAGGAICMELLTNNGWLVTNTIESLLLQIRMAISSTDPKPARLESSTGSRHGGSRDSYSVGEAIEAYKRACRAHGWDIPKDIDMLQMDTRQVE